MSKKIKEFETTGATFSPCKEYRYNLFRIWDSSLKILGVVMLNPSKAGDKDNDNTINSLIRIAASNGYGGIDVVNLYALISEKPSYLNTHYNPLGKNNHEYIDALIGDFENILLAWGSHKFNKIQIDRVLYKFHHRDFLCLKINADGNPKHPLYCKGDSKLLLYKNPAKI